MGKDKGWLGGFWPDIKGVGSGIASTLRGESGPPDNYVFKHKVRADLNRQARDIQRNENMSGGNNRDVRSNAVKNVNWKLDMQDRELSEKSLRGFTEQMKGGQDPYSQSRYELDNMSNMRGEKSLVGVVSHGLVFGNRAAELRNDYKTGRAFDYDTY